ncbi:aquaporin-like protein, partial [Rozella allomycis CSF55]
LAKALLGEFLATFIFLFVVMATGVNVYRLGGDAVGIIIGGVGTGFTAVAVIYSFADVSGAHFNPAVTFGTMVMGKTSWIKGAGYIGVQLFAAVIATAFLAVVFPEKGNVVFSEVLVSVYKDTNVINAVVTEFILSFILVYVIFAVAFDTVDSTNAAPIVTGNALKDRSIGRNLTIYTTSGSTKAGFAPIAIGFTLGFLCFIGGSTSGGAFNPARAFGPAILTGKFDLHWVYWLGDFAGAAFAGFIQSFLAHKPKQASGSARI